MWEGRAEGKPQWRRMATEGTKTQTFRKKKETHNWKGE